MEAGRLCTLMMLALARVPPDAWYEFHTASNGSPWSVCSQSHTHTVNHLIPMSPPSLPPPPVPLHNPCSQLLGNTPTHNSAMLACVSGQV